MTNALLTETASPATLAKQKAFRNAVLAAREKLATTYEAEAVRELAAAVEAANERIKERIAVAYASGPPEDWSYSKMLATGRLEQLQGQLEAELTYLNNGAVEITNRYAMYAFIRDAEKISDALAALGIPIWGVTLDMATVATFVNFPVAGTIFGERFAKLTATAQADGRQVLLNGLVNGDGPDVIIRRFREVTGLNRNAAESITRTTIMNASNQGHAYVYEKAGIVGIRRNATLDARTCAICLAKDGEILPVEKAHEISVHPECRCVPEPVTDWPEGPRRGKDYEDGKAKPTIFPADMTGIDYLKQLPEEQQIQVLGVNRVNLLNAGEVAWGDLWDADGDLVLLRDLDVSAGFNWIGGRPQ
jgi:SPP1 gp7 family putative phage head morphogenesis protein